MKDIIQKVVAAEEEARQILASAKEEATQIVANGRNEADSLSEEKKIAFQEEADAILKSAIEEAQAKADSDLEAAKERILKEIRLSDDLRQGAAEAVAEAIINASR